MDVKLPVTSADLAGLNACIVGSFTGDFPAITIQISSRGLVTERQRAALVEWLGQMGMNLDEGMMPVSQAEITQ